jgi:hypothetical protein
MMLSPALRRFAFAAHVTSSVGWLGAVTVFIPLAGVGLISRDEVTVRGAYLVMAPAAWFVLVPLAHASFVSGVTLSLGTAWGLFRHYWVVFKLLITVFSTVILLVYMGTFRQMAGVAADPLVDLDHVRNMSPMLHAVLALALLLTATWLGIYKPLGVTPYGRRVAERASTLALSPEHPSGISSRASVAGGKQRDWKWFLLLGVGCLLLLLLIQHVIGGGAGSH